MRESKKEWEDILFYAIPQNSFQIIKNLSYFLIEIIIGI